jgi:divalent metal cation (Fe/Co/Zn/Cd) transporter
VTHSQNGVQHAIKLEAITIFWMLFETGGSIGAGLFSRSMLLIAFGADSVIEIASAVLLYWRLSKEVHSESSELLQIDKIEEKVTRISGYLLYILAIYVILQSAYGLMHHHSADTSFLGVIIAVLAAVGMPVLARAKIRIANEIGSGALRADAMETFTCGYLSWVLLGGLIANAALRWWWLDNVAALILVPFLLKEGAEAVTGKCSCQH